MHQRPCDSPASAGATGARATCRRRPSRRAAALAAGPILLALAGCAGRSTILSGGPSVGQLKTSVAHLEYENAQMKRDLARLKRENREMGDRLVQQEQDNGELTARLDDARNLLRDRGLDSDASPAGGEGVRTLPAGQQNRKRRKPPVAQIRGTFTPAAPDRGLDTDAEEEPGGMLGPPQAAPGSGEGGGDSVGLRFGDDPYGSSSNMGNLRWTPIAGPAGDSGSRIR